MRIEYRSTIDEATDAGFRLAELAGAVRRQLWFGLAMAPLLFAMIFFVIDDRIGGLAVGAAAVLLWIPYHLSEYKKQIKKRIRKTLVRALGTAEPIPSEFELDENGLAFRRLGQELRFSWTNMVRIDETGPAIEVVMHPTGIAFLPKRMFKGPDEIHDWIRFIEEHRKSNPAPEGRR